MKRLLAMLCAATAAMTAPQSAAADPQLGRFYLPRLDLPEFAGPGPDGAVWFSLSRALGRVDADGRVTRHATGRLEPLGPTAGPDGAVWFIANNESVVGRMTVDGM